jgi:enoyl-CoA hydratase/carnithine racemase
VDLAHELAALPSIAVAMAKRAMYQAVDLPLDLALTLEAEASFRLKQSPAIMEPMREYLALPLEERRDWLDGASRG